LEQAGETATPEGERELALIEVQESQTAALHEFLLLLTKTGQTESEMASIRQLLDGSCIGSLFPMTAPWVVVNVALPTARHFHARLARMAFILGIQVGPDPPDLFKALAAWLAAASDKMLPGMTPTDWDDRLADLASQADEDDQMKLEKFKESVNHLPATVEEWHKAISRATRLVVERATNPVERVGREAYAAAYRKKSDWVPANNFLWLRPMFKAGDQANKVEVEMSMIGFQLPFTMALDLHDAMRLAGLDVGTVTEEEALNDPLGPMRGSPSTSRPSRTLGSGRSTRPGARVLQPPCSTRNAVLRQRPSTTSPPGTGML